MKREYLEALASINDVQFHADRYESGKHFQNAIKAAKNSINLSRVHFSYDADFTALKLSYANEAAKELAQAFISGCADGYRCGLIPCLGGYPANVWSRVVTLAADLAGDHCLSCDTCDPSDEDDTL